MNRRDFLQGTVGAAAMTLLSNQIFAADVAGEIALPELGRLKPLTSKAIKASRMSIGFETLDRQYFDPNPTYEPLGKLGVKWARVQTGWCRCEPEQGKYDFRWLDEIADNLLAQGVEPWFSLSYGNPFYTPEAKDAVSSVGWCPIYTEKARAGWTTYVDAITQHFADRVKKWEIWNEPNINGFWRYKKPTDDIYYTDSAKDYVKFVELTEPVIRRRIPDATIVGLSLGTCKTPYMEDALKAGLADHVDRISFHPYSLQPEHQQHEEFVARLRELLGDQNDRVKLWQGECGCASAPVKRSGKTVNYSEPVQAKWVVRRILTDLRRDMELTSIFLIVDLMNYGTYDKHGKAGVATNPKGLLRGKDCSPKPSYYAYQSLCSLFDAAAKFEPRLKIVRTSEVDRPQEFQSAGFARDGRALCAYWLSSHLLCPRKPQTVSLQVSLPADATIEQPVLVDPLSQRVYDLKDAASKPGELVLTGLPLFDYPLIVTDRSAVPM